MLRSLIFLIFISMLGVFELKAEPAVSLKKNCQTDRQESLSCFQDISKFQTEVLQLQEDSIKKVESLLENSEFQEFVADLQEKLPDIQKSKTSHQKGELLIFVSWSLGEKALLNLAIDASRYGGTLILRGFIKGSFKKTTQALQKIITKTGQGFIVDPELYELFNVTAAPTFILTKPFQVNASERNSTPFHDRLQGDISLHFALERFAKEGDLKQVAQTLLERGKS